MERLTKRDEYGNADIIGVDIVDLQLNLNFAEFNRVTNAINKLADYEDEEQTIKSALEKQTPKKPINYDSVPYRRCPACHNAVKVFEDAHEYHYCLYCGQALDWSDE